MDSPSTNISFHKVLVANGKQALYENGLSIASQCSLIITRAIKQSPVTNTQKYLAGNSRCDSLQGSPPNHSLKLTENTACFWSARKKLFREMATRSARIVSGDPAVRRRSLAPVR